MKITKDQFVALLGELFEVPVNSDDTTDLADYIKDSIDVGELLSALKVRYQTTLETTDFHKVHTIGEVWALIEAQA